MKAEFFAIALCLGVTVASALMGDDKAAGADKAKKEPAQAPPPMWSRGEWAFRPGSVCQKVLDNDPEFNQRPAEWKVVFKKRTGRAGSWNGYVYEEKSECIPPECHQDISLEVSGCKVVCINDPCASPPLGMNWHRGRYWDHIVNKCKPNKFLQATALRGKKVPPVCTLTGTLDHSEHWAENEKKEPPMTY
jgi:hypothetical protein